MRIKEISNARRGFTLIEILLVVIIIGALAAMVVPRFTGRSKQAKIAIAKVDINTNITTALKMYELDNGTFPTTDQGLKALLNKPSVEPLPKNWNGPYLERKYIDPWGHPYVYRYPSNHGRDYDLSSNGPNGRSGDDDDITNWE